MTVNTVTRPLIAHIVFSFDYGGLENGLVNLINHMQDGFAEHVIIALSSVSDFSERIKRDDVRVFCLQKPPGQTYKIFPKLYRLLQALRPDIVHTRNLATLECQVVAFAARIKYRVHGEHGWDTSDPNGTNPSHIRIRRLMKQFTHHQIGLSNHICTYLAEQIKIDRHKLTRICNGVDTNKFKPLLDQSTAYFTKNMPQAWSSDSFVIGTTGRASPIKNQMALCQAFVLLRKRNSEFAAKGKLAILGNGPLLEQLSTFAVQQHIDEKCWFPGARDDVSEFLQHLSVFVLPSFAEGISNSILEAMAAGLPIIASGVGGTPELVQNQINGVLLEPNDVDGIAGALETYFNDDVTRRKHGAASRNMAEHAFSIQQMVRQYCDVYKKRFN